MQTAEANFSGIEHFLDAWHERQPNAVTELDEIKTELGLNFPQHCFSVGVSSGVPTGGKRDHAKQRRRPVAARASQRRAFRRLPVVSIVAAREQAPLARLCHYKHPQ